MKRTGQLLTGSHARSLKKQLKGLSSASGNLSESIEAGNKMLKTQTTLKKEVGKVRAARAGALGTAAGVGMITSNQNKQQELNM